MLVQIHAFDDHIAVRCPYVLRERCQSVTGGKWDKKNKRWTYPRSHATVRDLALSFDGCSVTFNDEFRHMLDECKRQDRLALNKEAKDLPDVPSKTDAWLHQRRAFWSLHSHTGSMLAMDMGTGKSKVAVDLVNHWESQVVVVLTPLSCVGVWSREFSTHSLRTFRVFTPTKRLIKDRFKEIKNFYEICLARKDKFVIVLNHESCWRNPIADFLISITPDALIVDESHRAKAPKGSFSKYLAKLGPHCKRRLALTGTPMPHSPLDIFAQYRFIDPGVYGTSYTKFRYKYAVHGGFEGKQVVGYQNTDELTDRFKRISFRVKIRDALQNLPEEVHFERRFNLTEETMRVYKDLEKDFYARVDDGEVTADNALVRLLRLQQVTNGFVNNDDGGLSRISHEKEDALYDLLEDLDVKEPVVAFARFREDLSTLQKVAETTDRAYGEISGQRKDLTSEATMPDWVDFMGTQIQSGGVGIDLTRSAFGVYYSIGFNLGDFIQSIRRLARHGQNRGTRFARLIANDTIDEVAYKAMDNRENAIEAILSWRPSDV